MIPMWLVVIFVIGVYSMIGTMTFFVMREMAGPGTTFEDYDTGLILGLVWGTMAWPIAWWVILGIFISKHIIKTIRKSNVNKNGNSKGS